MILTLSVVCEHYQRAFTEYQESSTVVKSSKQFKSSKDQYSGSASLEASYKGFSASAKASWNNIFEATDSCEDYLEEKKSKTIKFNAGHFQIFRKVTTTVSINGTSASEVTKTYIQDYPKGKSDDYLATLSVNYMADYYGVKDGKPYYQHESKLEAMIPKDLIEKLINKWNAKNRQYEGWVNKHGYKRDKYGVNETNRIGEDLNNLFRNATKSAGEKSLTAAKARYNQFVGWVKKYGYDRDEYGQKIWNEYKKDLEGLLRSAS